MTVNDFVQEKKKRYQKLPLAACSLLLSQRQEILNNHLARVPNTPNQEDTLKMRDELFRV